MKGLWLSTLLLLASSFVIAQNNAGTCNITLNRNTTVPQFCYSIVERRFQGRPNFTLNGSVLVFDPLPENRQVEIEIDDNSDGLEAWSNLANAFVDSVRSGSLPYGKLKCQIVLNKYLDKYHNDRRKCALIIYVN